MPPVVLPGADMIPHPHSPNRLSLLTLSASRFALDFPKHEFSENNGPKDVSSRFGRRLKHLRLSRSMTQVGMAKKFGIDRSFISDVERGRKSISLPMLEVIALGMNITLSKLLEDP